MKIQIPKLIIYDFDGTIVDTAKLNFDGWQFAFDEIKLPNKYGNFELPPEFAEYQKGKSGEDAARYVYGENAPDNLINMFREIKKGYTKVRYGDSPVFTGFIEAHDYIRNNGGLVWVCTQANEEEVHSIFDKNLDLKQRLEDKVVLKGMFEGKKPDALIKTLELAGGIAPKDALYIGDAESDYNGAKKIGTGFVYFCPLTEAINPKIPKEVPMIRYHSDIISILGR
jgi:phosphoglycolate phosphatase-like HAD superfamily hydrolase